MCSMHQVLQPKKFRRQGDPQVISPFQFRFWETFCGQVRGCGLHFVYGDAHHGAHGPATSAEAAELVHGARYAPLEAHCNQAVLSNQSHRWIVRLCEGSVKRMSSNLPQLIFLMLALVQAVARS